MSANTSEVLDRVKISDVYAALGGPKLRGMRGPAFWRGGDGYNVSLDDERGVWKDFVSDEGGGVLDLAVRVHGGSRADALRWLADLAGVPLDDKPLSPEDRARWAAERRALERDLPMARFWQRAALNLTEDLLDVLKAALSDPVLPLPEISEICHVDALLASLRRADGTALIEEYRWWLAHYPGMTHAMVRAAKARGQADRQALLAYFRLTDPERRAS